MGSCRASRFRSTNEQFSMRLDVFLYHGCKQVSEEHASLFASKFSEPDRVHLVDTGNESVFDDCGNARGDVSFRCLD